MALGISHTCFRILTQDFSGITHTTHILLAFTSPMSPTPSLRSSTLPPSPSPLNTPMPAMIYPSHFRTTLWAVYSTLRFYLTLSPLQNAETCLCTPFWASPTLPVSCFLTVHNHVYPPGIIWSHFPSWQFSKKQLARGGPAKTRYSGPLYSRLMRDRSKHSQTHQLSYYMGEGWKSKDERLSSAWNPSSCDLSVATVKGQ